MKPRLLAQLFSPLLLVGCYALSERPGGPLPQNPTYREALARSKIETPEPFSPEVLAQCPQPNGVFQNKASESHKAGTYQLTFFFNAIGVKRSAIFYSGGKPEAPPIPSLAMPEELVMQDQEGVIQRKASIPRVVTFELRPIGQARFRARLADDQSNSGEGTVKLRLSPGDAQGGASSKICENGQVKSTYLSKLRAPEPAWRFFVEPGTGDIVVLRPSSSGGEEIMARYKRIAP